MYEFLNSTQLIYLDIEHNTTKRKVNGIGAQAYSLNHGTSPNTKLNLTLNTAGTNIGEVKRPQLQPPLPPLAAVPVFGVLVDEMNAQWGIIQETEGHRPSLLRFNHISGVDLHISGGVESVPC